MFSNVETIQAVANGTETGAQPIVQASILYIQWVFIITYFTIWFLLMLVEADQGVINWGRLIWLGLDFVFMTYFRALLILIAIIELIFYLCEEHDDGADNPDNEWED